MNIIKDPATRKISFVENGLTIQVLDEQVTANFSRERSGIIIEDRFSKRIEIVTNQIDTYQVLPAVPVKFIGKTVDLWDVLFNPSAAPLFEEQHVKYTTSGGGPVVENNITTVAVATYSVLTSDYILWVTVASTLTLPTIAAASIGRVYRIFARNVKVTVNASGGDLINGAASVSLKKYDMITLRAGVAGAWGIGD